MPGRSGLELQRELYAANRQLPTIFITAHGGLARDRARRESEKAFDELRNRFDSLSSREREIMIQATAGRLNKQIAYGIGIAEATVKVHRSNLMRKMKARSLPELSRMADKLGLAPEKPPRSC
jgi:FixJ family two-component response regulator